MKVTAWEWSSEDASRDRAMKELVSGGASWFHLPDAVDMIRADPQRFVQRTTGRRPVRLEVIPVVATQGRSFDKTQGEAQFHTDSDRASPPLQYLVCDTPASDGGGVSRFVDTWRIAGEIRRTDRELFEALFNQVRIMRFSFTDLVGFTFSFRNRSLVCTHPYRPLDGDWVGRDFQERVDRASPTEIRLSSGDVSMSSNHRMLHSRTAFEDPKRRLILVLAWFEEPLDQAPDWLLEPAKKSFERVSALMRDESPWVQNMLGLSSPEVELARLPAPAREAILEVIRALPPHELIAILKKSSAKYRTQLYSYFLQRLIATTGEALAGLPEDREAELETAVDLFNRLHRELSARPRRGRAKRKAA